MAQQYVVRKMQPGIEGTAFVIEATKSFPDEFISPGELIYVSKEVQKNTKVAEPSASTNNDSFQLPNLSKIKEMVKQHDLSLGNSGDFGLLQIDGMCIMYRCIENLITKNVS